MSERRIRWGVVGAGGVADRQMLPNTREVSNAEWVAVMRRTAEGAQAMIDAGADVDARDDRGTTALMRAFRSPENLSILKAAGARE